MTKTSQISVVIPCFNAANFVVDAINSVIRQAEQFAVVIVIDDGSTDGTRESISERFGPEIVYVYQNNSGATSARNAGLRRVNTKYVMFLDADDLLGEEYLAGLYSAAEEAQADLTWGRFLHWWPSGRMQEAELKPPTLNKQQLIASLLTTGWTPPCAIMWRTEFVKSIGGWDESLQDNPNDDGELVLRAVMRNANVARSKISWALYRQHDGIRLSASMKRTSAVSQITIIERLIHDLGDMQMSLPLAQAVAQSAYEISVRLYQGGHDDLGERAEAIWRRTGCRPVLFGSNAHRWGVKLFGLKNKMKLSRFLRSLKH